MRKKIKQLLMTNNSPVQARERIPKLLGKNHNPVLQLNKKLSTILFCPLRRRDQWLQYQPIQIRLRHTRGGWGEMVCVIYNYIYWYLTYYIAYLAVYENGWLCKYWRTTTNGRALLLIFATLSYDNNFKRSDSRSITPIKPMVIFQKISDLPFNHSKL